MHDISIRPAAADDIPAVRALLVETWHDTYDPLIGAARVTEITDSWHSVENLTRQLSVADTSFLVAEHDGAIAGHVYANAQKAPVLTIARLYVLPGHQRLGIGKRLMAEAVRRHPGCNVVHLVVETGNTKGLAFYKREGFAPVRDVVIEDIRHIAMEKRLAPAQAL